jgi:hypothetical protein
MFYLLAKTIYLERITSMDCSLVQINIYNIVILKTHIYAFLVE